MTVNHSTTRLSFNFSFIIKLFLSRYPFLPQHERFYESSGFAYVEKRKVGRAAHRDAGRDSEKGSVSKRRFGELQVSHSGNG